MKRRDFAARTKYSCTVSTFDLAASLRRVRKAGKRVRTWGLAARACCTAPSGMNDCSVRKGKPCAEPCITPFDEAKARGASLRRIEVLHVTRIVAASQLVPVC